VKASVPEQNRQGKNLALATLQFLEGIRSQESPDFISIDSKIKPV
jgi:hypothetical protein